MRSAIEATSSTTSLIREWIELGLAEAESDRQISLAAVRRAIAHAAQAGHVA
ncbi:hypothetical protein [Skermania piniformis]|uniref:Uncharacterized protein n=1 Tax=Skermania pinensis TaxID=39122 RepID=A0ABX8S9E8_9ACTN|nr:hypothetical protein [Skermania piniformis]QXQ14499.1 hypothetical protein KV203_03575 [Skermania piniformis]